MKAARDFVYANSCQLFGKIQAKLDIISRSENLIVPPPQLMNYWAVTTRMTRNDDIQENNGTAAHILDEYRVERFARRPNEAVKRQFGLECGTCLFSGCPHYSVGKNCVPGGDHHDKDARDALDSDSILPLC